MATDEDHTFVDVGCAYHQGNLVKYVRCTKCGLLMEKGKLPVLAPTLP